MLCYIGPGTHTATAAIASGLFANPPSAGFPLTFHGCDSSGNALTPPDPDWTSDQPAWSTSGIPVIATTTNINTINLTHCFVRLIVFTASGATTVAPLNAASAMDWVQLTHSGSNTSAVGISVSVLKLTNVYVNMTGASYSTACQWANNYIENCKFSGVGGGGTSGNRHGVTFTGSSGNVPITRSTIHGFAGDGIGTTSATASHFMVINHCTIANNSGSGIKCNGTAAQTGHHRLDANCITGNGAYGIDAQSAAYVFATKNRLRDNTTANTNGFGNYPTTFDNYTTDSDDATEYVDASTYDFRIKNSAGIWGSGYGVSDQPAAGGGGLLVHPGMGGGMRG